MKHWVRNIAGTFTFVELSFYANRIRPGYSWHWLLTYLALCIAPIIYMLDAERD